MSELTGSIVVYKSDPSMLRASVESFLKSAPGCKLYVIDNSPTDEARFVADYPNVEYTFVGKNTGFGKAHNMALKRVMLEGSKYHVVINPDVYYSQEVLPRLTDFMNGHEDVGMVVPKVFYPDGRLQPVCRLLPSPSILILRRIVSKFRRIYDRLNHQYEMRFTGYDRLMDVPFLSGCFMFLRTDALRTTGLFDENIFLYTEDIDLTRRMHLQFRTVFLPDVSIFHHHVGSSKNLRLLWRHATSAITYFNKWGWFSDSERDMINKRTILRLARADQ